MITVFLLRQGIRAYGSADGVLHKKDCDGYKDYEYYMHLDNFVVLEQPLSASKMKEVTGHGFNFRQTLFSISEEDSKKIIDEIK